MLRCFILRKMVESIRPADIVLLVVAALQPTAEVHLGENSGVLDFLAGKPICFFSYRSPQHSSFVTFIPTTSLTGYHMLRVSFAVIVHLQQSALWRLMSSFLEQSGTGECSSKDLHCIIFPYASYIISFHRLMSHREAHEVSRYRLRTSCFAAAVGDSDINDQLLGRNQDTRGWQSSSELHDLR